MNTVRLVKLNEQSATVKVKPRTNPMSPNKELFWPQLSRQIKKQQRMISWQLLWF